MSYERFFNIDDNFHPVVDQTAISANPDLWKGYYPHETFVKLLKSALNVLEGTKKQSLWVKGAYGSGKSHAVLTLQKLVQSDESQVREYFGKYPDKFGADIMERFLATKRSNKVLTVHRSGSAQMDSHAMLNAVQESIDEALKLAGYSTAGLTTVRDEILNYLKDEKHRQIMALAMKQHPDLLPGKTVETLGKELETYTEIVLTQLVEAVCKLAERAQIRVGKLDHEILKKWILEVEKKNGLDTILFFWDEFSEFFQNNRGNLTAFQELSQLSGNGKFHFIIVTHDSNALFDNSSENGRKLADRFELHTIDLPENTAFRLLGTAMKMTKDEVLKGQWEKTIHPALSIKTKESRKLVKEKAHIDEKDLDAILPIHPYAALVLKHIAKTYASNQRSMFDFICHRDLDQHGFRWFIKERDPLNDEDSLLTMDMLWDFFYEKGLHNLSPEFRSTLMTYSHRKEGLGTDELTILKVVLLLDALSHSVKDVNYLEPTIKNIRLAVEGTELEHGYTALLDNLANKNILWRRELTGGSARYSAAQGVSDLAALNEKKNEIRAKKASDLFAGIDIQQHVVKLPADLKGRYEMHIAFNDNYASKMRDCRQHSQNGKLGLLFCLALNTEQQAELRAKIRRDATQDVGKVVIVDATFTVMDSDVWTSYEDSAAHSLVFRGKNNGQAENYQQDATDMLVKWLKTVFSGHFSVYSIKQPEGTEVTDRGLVEQIRARIGDFYPDALELWGHKVTDTLWAGNNMSLGVKCGAGHLCSGAFKASSSILKPENFIGDAWGNPKSLEDNPTAHISRLSKYVNEYIRKQFKDRGSVAMKEFVTKLRKSTFGLLPCNLTAFVLGFAMSNYAAETYQWSDGTTSTPMNVDKLAEMLKEALQGGGRREVYLRAMSDEMRSFVKATANIFDLEEGRCGSTELARNQVQTKMKSYRFPIWPLSDLASSESAAELIRLYVGLVNPVNYGDGDLPDVELASKIGRLCMDEPRAVDAAKTLLTRCEEGMRKYLTAYRDGCLISLSTAIGDNGSYLNRLAEKFDAKEALWVWSQDTADQMIEELITEYEITEETNKCLSGNAHGYTEAMGQWVEKCNAIAISCAAAENYWGDLKEFMETLLMYKVRKQAVKTHASKTHFLELLHDRGGAFRDFYANQPALFSRVCAAELNNIDPRDIAELYRSLSPEGIFEKSKTAYFQWVSEKAAVFVQGLGITRIKAWWREKTNSDSPREWSRQNCTPILCLVSIDELEQARQALSMLEMTHATAQDVVKAEQYLHSASFIRWLTDKAAVDNALLNSLASSDCRDMLRDKANELRKTLLREVGDDCYSWYPGNRTTEAAVRRFAEEIYCRDGYRHAESQLQAMDAEGMRSYLLEAVKTDMNLGLAILNHRKELL